MKRSVIFAGLALAILFGHVAFAQNLRTRAKVTVAFAFQVGDKILSAGEYTISADSGHNFVFIRNKDSSVHALAREYDILLLPVGSVSEKNKLVLRRDGDKYVLHQVVFAGDDHIHDLVHGTDVAELKMPSH